ncbi:MAG: tRNA (guanine-N7)-methyltransferase [Deltaproteobacteria bacterium]|nr:tRNA (guanine-N7)-methyltransferase [Deltaproteobacteria bacterium]
MLGRARQLPAWGFLAIEVRGRFARLIAERAEKYGLENVKVIHGDARRILPRLAPCDCLDRVSLHFPDPWWKKRHGKRAVLTPRTLEEVVRLLGPRGELFVQTDVFPRAVSILRILTDQPDIENSAADGGLLEKPVDDCPSNREQTCMQAGLPVFRMLFRKKNQ